MTSKIVVNNIESDSGISSVTFNSNIQIGSGTTIHSSGIDLGTGNLKGHNLESTGIITATTFVGNLTGNPTGSGANLTNLPAANITGTLPAIDGSALTGVGVGTADSINTSGIITATAFVSDTPLTHRNLLINGEMKINQRVQTGSLGYYNPVTSSIYTLDRWKISLGGGFDTDSAKIYHSTTAPTSEGFTKSLKVDIGNTETPSSGQRANIGQSIEGQDLQHLRYGTSSAKTMTLSFWVYSNKTGIYSVQIVQENKKYVLYDYTISSADTWEKKTITIVGNTADTIDNDNGVGFYVDWFLCANSDVSVSPTSSWTSGSNYRASTNQVNLWDNSNNYWYLTGCQLELGSVATPFEHLSYCEELIRCQRYFQKMVDTDGVYFGGGYMYDHYRGYLPVTHYVTMRAAPSMQTVTGSNYYSLHRNGSGDNFDGFNNWFAADENHGTLQTTSGLSGTGGHAGQYWSNNAACKITFTAEL